MNYIKHEIEWTPEKSKRLWDYYGSSPAHIPTFFGYQAGPLVAKMLFSKAKFHDNSRLLDFSAGRGDIVAACLKHMRAEQEIHATDFSDTYVQLVQQRCERNPRFKGARLTTALPTAYPDGFFDVVIATEVLEHLLDDELDGMLGECVRILKPGGQVFFTTPNEENYDASKVLCPDCGCIFHRWQHVRTWTAETLKSRIEAAGFTTRVVQAVAWQRWTGKLRSLIMNRKISKTGLVYVGEKVNEVSSL